MLLRKFRSGEVRTGRLKRKATAEDIVNITDNHKSTGVNLSHNGAYLRQLCQLDDYENQLAVTMRKAALAADIGNTAANDFNNRFRNFLVMLADDNNLLFIIKACRKRITGFGHHKKVSNVYNTGSIPNKETLASSRQMLKAKPVVLIEIE